MPKPAFDDIDLELDADAEFEKFNQENPLTEELESAEVKDEGAEEPTAEGDGEGADEPAEGADEPAAGEGEAESEEAEAQTDDSTPEPEAGDPQKALLDELRAERQQLQAQLNELSVASMMDKKKLTELETAIKTPEPAPEPAGPTPEEILGHIDQRIAQTEAALTEAETTDPSTAPALRQQLRQLERHYLDFKGQQQLLAAKGPDPEELVQRAAQEAQQQSTFNAVRRNVVVEYPELDQGGESFNEKLRDQIHRIYNPMLKEGTDPADALIEATTLVMRANGVMSTSERTRFEAEQAAATEAAATTERAELEKKAAANTRKQEAVERNLKAAKDTPPNLGAAGKSNESTGPLDKYDFDKMSIADMMKINDDEEEQIEAALALYND